MASGFLSPCAILFTQNSIKNEFRNGLSLEDTACQLASNVIQKRTIEMMKVVKHGERFYSLDNRRLAVFRLLQLLGNVKVIKVFVVPKAHVEVKWRRKFDADALHTQIVVRGLKYVIADTLGATTFPLQRIRAAIQDTRVVNACALVATQSHRVESILAGMDSDDDEDEADSHVLPLGRRPPDARQPLKCPPRRKNAFDQRRGSKSTGNLSFSDNLEPFAAGKSRYAYRCRVQNGCFYGFSEGENYILERELFGKFRKFNSNNGWCSQTGGELPAAFSHWTWATTGKLVCDLQGYQGKPPGPTYLGASHYYLLTDPAIMSPEQRYGITDLGTKGIGNWFSVHKCNGICRALGIASKRPPAVRTMPVESSSSLRETANSYGPQNTRHSHNAFLAAALPVLEEDEHYDSSGEDYW